MSMILPPRRGCLSLTAGLLGITCLASGLRAQDSASTLQALRLVADAVLSGATFQLVDHAGGQRFSSPDEAPAGMPLEIESPSNDWRYWNGVLNLGMIRLGTVLREPRYADYVTRDIAFCFDSYPHFKRTYAGEGKWSYPFGQLFTMEELDDYGAMGASLIEVHRRHPQDRYGNYLREAARYALTRQTRLEDGTFVRSFPRRWTLWADDLYMSVSFLSRFGEASGERKFFDDAARQVINFQAHLFDTTRGLMHHDWYSDTQQPGVAFWGRANGWALLAQVDLLERIPLNHPARDTLLALLRRHLAGVLRYQESGGLWHQLLDRRDSYLETSCSAMFTYALARSVNKGYVSRRYAEAARRGWEGVLTRISPDGRISGVCAGTGVSDDIQYYYRRPAPLNDPHGIGAVLFAGAEVLQLLQRGNRVAFLLHAPGLPDSAAVYIAGSVEQLGMWDPGTVGMESRGGHVWEREIMLPQAGPVEYKFTLGSWDREGADSAGLPLSNSRALILRDTSITDTIRFWKRGDRPGVLRGQITGTVRYHRALKGGGLRDRDIVVWLPPGYDEKPDERYPVVYMQDGQNIFDPATSAFGVDWGIDETADSLIRSRVIPPVIVVGVYNTPDRMKEYVPGEKGTAYMNFLAGTLKPFIDSTYRTRHDAASTIVGGASAGGTIAFMLVWKHPDLFSKAICLSPAFIAPPGGRQAWNCTEGVGTSPKKEGVFIYMANGGVGIDTVLQPGVDQMLRALRAGGYEEGKDFLFARYPHAKHFEADWGREFPEALKAVLRRH